MRGCNLQNLIFLLALVLVIAAYDLWMLNRHGSCGTISGSVEEWSRESPLVAYLFVFGLGLLCGHLFLK